MGVSAYALKGEIDYTLFGLLFTLSGAFLAALKVSPPPVLLCFVLWLN